MQRHNALTLVHGRIVLVHRQILDRLALFLFVVEPVQFGSQLVQFVLVLDHSQSQFSFASNAHYHHLPVFIQIQRKIVRNVFDVVAGRLIGLVALLVGLVALLIGQLALLIGLVALLIGQVALLTRLTERGFQVVRGVDCARGVRGVGEPVAALTFASLVQIVRRRLGRRGIRVGLVDFDNDGQLLSGLNPAREIGQKSSRLVWRVPTRTKSGGRDRSIRIESTQLVASVNDRWPMEMTGGQRK